MMSMLAIGVCIGISIGAVPAGIALMEKPRWFFEFTIAVLFTAMVVLVVANARAGELVFCENVPGKGRWVYRDVDGRKCWFPANGLKRGEEKPLEELKWPRPIGAPPVEVEEKANGSSKE